MKLTSEQIHKICNLQHKVMICKIYLKDSTGLYTSERIGEMFDDLELLSKMDNYLKELNEFLTTIDVEDVKETFSDKEFLQLPENKFTFDLAVYKFLVSLAEMLTVFGINNISFAVA